eukprot:TRINITY_DN33899_c0_g1_i1.p1 TRINITY_DN33899_c0_g1~~TRINITY_DN33899_c0_g1_i1.p1  ORF type:complete len:276 (-),score=35.12 TRINITY_DN33899_c0_g1_i1:168-893(-)
METYELTQEDHTLALVFRINSQRARRRPHPAMAFDAQRRAACLAVHVAQYKPLPSLQASDDCPYSGALDSDVCGGDEVMSDKRSASGSNADSFLLDGGNDHCRSADEGSRVRDASAQGHRWKLSTSMWKMFRQTPSRVMPASDAPEMQSQSESGDKEPVQRASLVPRMIGSLMRRTSWKKHGKETQKASFSSLASTQASDEDSCSVDTATFDPSSRSFVEKHVSGFRAVIRKVRASAPAKA